MSMEAQDSLLGLIGMTIQIHQHQDTNIVIHLLNLKFVYNVSLIRAYSSTLHFPPT